MQDRPPPRTSAMFQQYNAMMKEFHRASAEVTDVLQRNPRPDTFLGRKTHEPFPMQDEME